MNRLVFTCHADGSVETLLKDKVLDTRKFGNRRIERVSEILPTDDGQSFYVRWLKGPLVGSKSINIHSLDTIYANGSISCWYDGQTMFFDTYEDAVAHEVACVNALRLAGHSFA